MASPAAAATHSVASCPKCRALLLKPDRDGRGTILFSQRRTLYAAGTLLVWCPRCGAPVELDPRPVLDLLSQDADPMQRPAP